MRSAAPPLAACLLLLLACGDRVLTSDAAATTTTTSEPATASTGAPALPTTGGDSSTGEPAMCGCATLPTGPGCGDDVLFDPIPDCPVALICPTLTARCSHPNDDLYFCQDDIVFDEPALACILIAMRDRTPGGFIVEGTDDGLFSGATTRAVRLLGGDAVVYTACQQTDVEAIRGASRATLAAPDHFAECLAAPEPAARHACLLAGLLERTALPACGE